MSKPLTTNEPEVKGISTKPRAVKRTPPGPDAEDIIICREVHKWFGELHVLNGINITVKQGEVLVIAGPSGSGKSTWIRTINRLEEHHAATSSSTVSSSPTTSATSPPSAPRSAWFSSSSTSSHT